MSDSTAQQLRQQIAELVGRYAELQMAPKPFVAGQSSVPPSGKVIGAGELQSMTEAVLDGWLTTGRFNEAFEMVKSTVELEPVLAKSKAAAGAAEAGRRVRGLKAKTVGDWS